MNAGAPLPEEEKAIVARSSFVNGIVFPPFAPADAAQAGSSGNSASPFVDLTPLGLSPAQKQAFSHWARPRSGMKMGPALSINQGPIQNCSFICTTSLLSQLLQGFPRSVMFPSDSLSPNGRYHFKLWFNGLARLVAVDDRLPVTAEGDSLCVSSGEVLWPMLLEKAFCKLLSGGYDFWQGSTSGFDAYVMTGWPPETIALKDIASAWTGLRRGLARGDNLVTLTSSMSLDERLTGLARGHTYAVIDARQVGAHRFLRLRNPWGKASWRGALSRPEDWPDALRAALNFKPDAVARGVFWLRLEDATHHFASLEVNWNVSLFPYTHRVHVCLPADLDDTLHVGDCFQLRVEFLDPNALCWVAVVRHITAKAHIQGDDEFALGLHKSPGQTKRVFYLKPGERGMYNTAPVSTVAFERVHGPVVISLSRYKPGKLAIDATVIFYSTAALGQIMAIPLVLPGGSCVGTASFAQGAIANQMQTEFEELSNPLWLIRRPSTAATYRARLVPSDPAALVGLKVFAAGIASPGRCMHTSIESKGFCFVEWTDSSAAEDYIIVVGYRRHSVVSKQAQQQAYNLTIECSQAGMELVPPTEPSQQAALRRLLS